MEQSSSSPRHFVIVGVLILISTVVLNWLLDAALPLPVQASLQAVNIDWLFGLHVLLIAFLFSLIVVFMGYALIVFRRREGDDGDGEHFEGNTKLEIAWTSAPMIFVIIFSVLGVVSLNEVTQAYPNEVPVKVVASQWQFIFYYGEGDHEPMEEGGTPRTDLVLTVDQPYIMQMRSQDVMHAFWVPAFRVKQDIIPSRDPKTIHSTAADGHGDDSHGEEGEAHSEEGESHDEEGEGHSEEGESHDGEDESHSEEGAAMEHEFPTVLRFTPTLLGKYKLRCAELCGLEHYKMISNVYVVEADEHERFLAGEEIYCIVDDVEHDDYERKCVES